jgi:hypothetical protein
MYQALICRARFPRTGHGDNPRCLAALLDAQNMERLAHALIDGVRRNAQLERDFL